MDSKLFEFLFEFSYSNNFTRLQLWCMKHGKFWLQKNLRIFFLNFECHFRNVLTTMWRGRKKRMMHLFRSLANAEKWLVIREYYAPSKNENNLGRLCTTLESHNGVKSILKEHSILILSLITLAIDISSILVI